MVEKYRKSRNSTVCLRVSLLNTLVMSFAGASLVRFPRPATEENPQQGRTSKGILLFRRNKSFHPYDSARLYGTMGKIDCEESIDMCYREAVSYAPICQEAYLCAQVYNEYGGIEEISLVGGCTVLRFQDLVHGRRIWT